MQQFHIKILTKGQPLPVTIRLVKLLATVVMDEDADDDEAAEEVESWPGIIGNVFIISDGVSTRIF